MAYHRRPASPGDRRLPDHSGSLLQLRLREGILNDRELVDEWRRVINYAAAKQWRKWRPLLDSVPESGRPVGRADFGQAALEGLLLMAGRIPGRKHNLNGKLGEIMAKGGEAWVQRSLDLYVAAWAHHEVEAWRAAKRGGGNRVPSLQDWAGSCHNEEGSRDTYGDYLDALGRLETSGSSVAFASLRWPLLWAAGVDGRRACEVWKAMGISNAEYRARRALELKEFTAWATRNRRLAA